MSSTRLAMNCTQSYRVAILQARPLLRPLQHQSPRAMHLPPRDSLVERLPWNRSRTLLHDTRSTFLFTTGSQSSARANSLTSVSTGPSLGSSRRRIHTPRISPTLHVRLESTVQQADSGVRGCAK